MAFFLTWCLAEPVPAGQLTVETTPKEAQASYDLMDSKPKDCTPRTTPPATPKIAEPVVEAKPEPVQEECCADESAAPPKEEVAPPRVSSAAMTLRSRLSEIKPPEPTEKKRVSLFGKKK